MSLVKTKATVEKEIIVAAICDGCKKRIKAKDIPEGWFYFSSGHTHWGNDSVDSYEYHLACSPLCFIDIVENIIKENLNCVTDYSSGEIAEMPVDFAQNLVKLVKGNNG